MKRKATVMMMTCLIIVLAMSNMVFAKKANKALRVKVSYAATAPDADGNMTNDWEANIFFGAATLPKKTALKKNMTISGKVYLPVSWFTSPYDRVIIVPGVDVAKAKKGKFVGGLVANRWIRMSVNDGKPVIALEDQEEGIKAGSASCKVKGKYYEVSFSGLQMASLYIKKNGSTGKFSSLVGKKKYILSPNVQVQGAFVKGVKKSYYYIDDLVLKSGKTQKVNFSNSKKYTNVYGKKKKSVKVTTLK